MQRPVEASGIELRKGGKDLLGRCPFQEDVTASLVVTPGKSLLHCFGSGVGGEPIDWVTKRQGVSFRHAVELLKQNVGGRRGPSRRWRRAWRTRARTTARGAECGRTGVA